MTTIHATPVAWGGGEPIPGTPFRVAVPGEATGGHAVCITVDMPPGIRVDEHVHEDEDQLCVVVSDRIATRVGGGEAFLEAGGVQLLPRGVPHELWNAGDRFARLIEIYTPPGMGDRFARGGELALAAGSAQAGDAEYRSVRTSRGGS